MTQESLTEKLSVHLMRPVDEATRQRARLHLLDWLGCVAGAHNSGQAKKKLGDFSSRSAWLGNVLEMDDVHRSSILHPGPVIWPALESPAGTMNSFLDAAVRGYEAIIAIGSTFDDRHYSFYHNTATAGAFGAAIVSMGDEGLDQQVMVNAMGLVGSIAGGLWQMRHEHSDAKQWHISHAHMSGVEAGMAAEDGAIGPRFILEGPQGLYAATCESPKPMTFPDQWRIHEVSFKPWGACRHAHPAIDAALKLKAKLQVLDGDIYVETYADAISFCDRPDPLSVIDAKFSIQHALAIVAERGVPQLADFEPEAIAALAKARSRIKVSEASDITARYPDHYGARVSGGGESIELVDTLGDPERPLSYEGMINKTRALVAWGGLSEKEADRAIDLALKTDNPHEIHQMLQDWLS